MGRKRKPDSEKKVTVFLRLPNPIFDDLVSKFGNANKICEKIVLENYLKYLKSEKD